jgi:hypothetical protein
MPRRLSARLVARLACSLVALATVSTSLAARAAESASLTRASEAPALVQAALDAELAGDPARRAALLAKALKADPDFAPARWHNGQVKFDGRWRKLEEVQELVAKDPRWIGYRELRHQLGLAPGDHLLLAEYCREHDLAPEGRYHWTNVLLADPQSKAARAYLGLQVHHGRLFTAEQLAAMDQWTKDAEANRKRHRPAMTRLCRDATRGAAAGRAAALKKISALDDLTAIAALEEAAKKACEKSPKFADDLHVAVVAALGNMPQHEATLRLLNHAVYADAPAVRQAAARALRPRPQTDYVPLLMAALRAPIEVDFDVLATPDGSVRVSETIRKAGPLADAVHTRQTNHLTEGAFGYDPNRSNPAAVLGANIDQAAARLAATEARVEAANADAEETNARIAEVLRVVTGEELSEGAQAWWASWQSFNELQSLADEVVETHEQSNLVYFYPQAPVLYPRREPPVGRLTPRPEPRPQEIRRWKNGAPMIGDLRSRGGVPGRFRNGTPISVFSCFVPGTPVWTPEGPVAIERLAIGDLVLAQNPHTGEVAYRPVLETTVGEPTGVVNLQVAGETIGATLGHRFWVSGAGWVMAKQLESSSRLHSLRGFVEVRAVESAPIVDCYNLRVDEFHTFFVGKARVLVHDNTCPEPERAAIPGSQTARTSQADVPRSPVSLER